MNLKKVYQDKGFVFKAFDSSEDAILDLQKELKGRTITFGGSSTCDELNLYEILGKDNRVSWHWKGDEMDSAPKDVYMASTNALTKDGKLVNVDGTANRVTNMVYGHKDVYIIAGKNKLVDDYEAAVDRIKSYVAVENAKRFDAQAQDIYKVEVIIHQNPSKCQIHIYFIDEDLGL